MTESIKIIVTSNGVLTHIAASIAGFIRHDCQMIIVDEGDRPVRRANAKLLSRIPHRFYGPLERRKWFQSRFGSGFERIASVIPIRCHAENSFGFLTALEDGADFAIELDDDVSPVGQVDFVNEHILNLGHRTGNIISSYSRWYNPMDNLRLNVDSRVFPRGFPYDERVRNVEYSEKTSSADCVLNMGLWTAAPDLDAVTILYHGGLDGYCNIRSGGIREKKVIVDRGSYLPICSMNTAFRTEIVPAFYQLFMNFRGLDRYDDIWSGIFLKKIADHLDKRISVGTPVVEHRKSKRSTFRDLRRESEGIAMNEFLWKVVDEAEISGSTYFDCYDSLVLQLKPYIRQVKDLLHRKLLAMQVQKMALWLETVRAIT